MMRLSVCLRCGAVFFFKQMNEVVCVFVACCQCDFMNLFLCGEKQVFRGFQSLFVQVFDGRHPEGGGKLMTDSVFAHVTVVFQILQLQRPVKMVVNIMFQLPQIGGIFFLSLFRGFRDGRSCEKLRQNGGYETGVPQLGGQIRIGFADEKLFQVPQYGRMPVNL